MGTFTPQFIISNSVTAGLAEIERARGFLEGAALPDKWLRRMGQRALLLEAHHTTHIEGTHLTIEQAERLWAGEQVEQTQPDDVRELLNYREAMHLVSDYLGSGEPITEGLIREIHKRLVAGVRGGEAAPGEYRRVQNYVASSATRAIIYTPPPPESVAPMMQELVAWLRADSGVHPVLVAAIAQFQLVHIHPFVDGNGRTSRLLSMLCLYRSGYDFKRLFTLSEFYDRDRTAFYQALQQVRESGMDLSGWLDFFVQGLATQLREVRSLGETALRHEALAQEHQWNERQVLAMAHLAEQGVLEIQSFERLCPEVSRRTLQRDLAALVQAGLVQQDGSTNNAVYRLAQGK
jgi:Fic family protein